jgi:hypothetical protein
MLEAPSSAQGGGAAILREALSLMIDREAGRVSVRNNFAPDQSRFDRQSDLSIRHSSRRLPKRRSSSPFIRLMINALLDGQGP